MLQLNSLYSQFDAIQSSLIELKTTELAYSGMLTLFHPSILGLAFSCMLDIVILVAWFLVLISFSSQSSCLVSLPWSLIFSFAFLLTFVSDVSIHCVRFIFCMWKLRLRSQWFLVVSKNLCVFKICICKVSDMYLIVMI